MTHGQALDQGERVNPQTSTASDQAIGEQGLTDAVAAGFDTAASPRYRDLMQSLVRHLHGFAREVRLTQEEWDAAIAFLTRVGHRTDERRQEFILLSDVLGLSMLTVAMNAPAAAGATESTVFGPFFVADAPEVALGGDIARGAKGIPCHVSGVVRSTEHGPLPGARVDVWEADADGLYDVQYDGERSAGRGRLRSGPHGEYAFWSVRPSPYAIPHDGPVGELLTAAGRGPMRPAHLHFKVEASGHRTLITHIFAAGDAHLDQDAVFGVNDSLVVEFTERPPGTAPDGRVLDQPWVQVEFDLVLAPGQEELR